ncbi:flagellar hook-length control protein FliK [Shewanella bicestrii]|uniref:Flagellar hook-length control protein FliK n=1 Tax=Shewanella bicestrii TaxID=2018305 RepID=A0A220UNT4_9GAMM|nr:flagellar hook-length control protein FliK [Shewanella bicestrii]ASK69884.1 flagellar hook-length control protein FliK [Shewanella bicestrii]
MESIPLINTANAQLITSAASIDAASVSSRPIPAEVQISPEGDSIILNGTEYNLKLVNAQQRQALIVASHFLVNQIAPQANTTVNATVPNAQLLTLGATLTLKLPDAIAQLAQQNGISLDKLYTLAARPQGYPLPNVTVTTKEFQFVNGTVVPQDPGTRLSAGEFQANISFSQGRPILVLTPILSKLEIQIGAPINETQLPIIDKQAANVVISKTEPVQVIATFLRKLEGLTPQAELLNTSKPSIQAQVAPDNKAAVGVTTSSATDNPTSKNNASALSIQTSLQANTEPKLTTVNQTLNTTAQSQETSQNQQKAQVLDAKTLESKAFESKPFESKSLESKPLELKPLEAKTMASGASNLDSSRNSLLAAKAQQELPPTSSTKTGLVGNELPLSLKPQAMEAQLGEKTNKSTEAQISVNEVLQKAFTKAGALPLEQMLARGGANLAAELLKHLPHLSPPTLGQLSDPGELKETMFGLSALNLAAPQLNPATVLMNANAITSLFQLLLGFRANNANNSISQKLADYLELLQAKTGLSTNLLGQLSKAGGLESMGQLASSLHLYQQASGENNGNLVWFFALPYGINQRHEQLEGKFERDANDDEQQKYKGWHLQLKFNLAQGPLLISARFHQQVLDIQFKGNSQQLLNRVDNFLAPLGQKLSQLGFTPGELSTQIAQVPATLLPGDHFLVKTRA